MKISVLTATYNRAKYLKRLYDSLKKNVGILYEIEWLIMDDGSTDDTKNICKCFEDTSGLKVRYFYQENQGKMAAINNIANYVSGELWIECDSDDYFIENTFEHIYNTYKQNNNRKDLYAFAFLKIDQSGNNMGNLFKKDINTMFDLYYRDGESGEKALVFISDIRKKYKYELENNERFVTEARMYHKMDREYKILCFNKNIMVCEYQKDGYTQNINKQFLNNPNGYYMYFYEILKDMNMSKVLFSKRLYVIKHYMLFTYLTNRKIDIKIKGLLNKVLILILYIPGIIKSKKFKKDNSKETF